MAEEQKKNILQQQDIDVKRLLYYGGLIIIGLIAFKMLSRTIGGLIGVAIGAPPNRPEGTGKDAAAWIDSCLTACSVSYPKRRLRYKKCCRKCKAQ